MNIVKAIIADVEPLPPITALGYEYIVAANGLFVRAEDSRIEAMLPVSHPLGAKLHGLKMLTPHIRLKIQRVPTNYLYSVLQSARLHLPNEVLYQFSCSPHIDKVGCWRCRTPFQKNDALSVNFIDSPEAVIDLHSHNSMNAFFSDTDNSDEAGLRFYCVIGRLDTDTPKIACRVGVYGNHWRVPVTTIFDGAGPFVDTFNEAEL